MKKNGILIHAKDQVLTLAAAVKVQETVAYTRDGIDSTQKAVEDIPQYHKMAVRDMKKGEKICKYGEEIGEATADIRAGEWVHIHNLQSSCIASKQEGET